MPTPGCYRVAPFLLAGPYPAPERVGSLEDAGVTRFVDLTHPSDPLEAYGHLLRSSHRRAHPTPDMGTPTAGHMMAILDDIDETVTASETVYVHCWGGVGRTGTVIGCWLVRHGLDEGDAIGRIAVLRQTLPDARRSPETDAQISLVRGWRAGW